MNRHNQKNKDLLCGLYEKHRDSLLVLGIALSNDVNIAEDALHDVFVEFARRIQEFKLTGSMKGYLSVCVANRVRDMLRVNRNRERILDEQTGRSESSNTSDPGKLIICNEQLQLLSSALVQLPYEQREVIALRMHGQMRFGAIAKSLGISANTAKGRYRYGIEKLRSILNGKL
ncbi:MAG: sigma-70 family RNA polymerase sigma factor [Sedimentisphaerales bacterium]|nr:sigma-70 family RNA polymerase sigma factor [Sedimentisphaerales bacterium]